MFRYDCGEGLSKVKRGINRNSCTTWQWL